MTDHESDREKYARRLAMFRSMGFDTSKLEDMLEHDFDKLKDMGFDHIREQLERAQRNEAEDEARLEAAKARTELPPPPPKPRWLERDDDRDRRLEDLMRRDHRLKGPPLARDTGVRERRMEARPLPSDVRRVRHYKDARFDDMDYREHDDFEDFETRETAKYYGPDERSKEPEFRPPPGSEELSETEGYEDEEEEEEEYAGRAQGDEGRRRELRFIDGMRREMLDRRDREDGSPPPPRYAPRERRMGTEGARPMRGRMERRMVEGREDRMRGSRRMMGQVRERPRAPLRPGREELIRRRKLERRLDTLDPMISFKPAKERVRPRLLDIEDEEEEEEEKEEGEEDGDRGILIGEKGPENGPEEGEEDGEDDEVAMIFVGDKKHKDAKEELFGGDEEEGEDEEEEAGDEERDLARTEIGPEPDDLEEEEEGVEVVHVVEPEPVVDTRLRPRPKLRPRPRPKGPPVKGPIQIRRVPETDPFALRARRPVRKFRGRGPVEAHPQERRVRPRPVPMGGKYHDARERQRYGHGTGRSYEEGHGVRRVASDGARVPGPSPRLVRKVKKKSTLNDREKGNGKGKGNLATFATVAIVIMVVLAAYYLFFLPTAVQAKITASKTDPTVAEEVRFSGSGSKSSSGAIGTYQWDFGDKSLITEGKDVTHTYGDEGDFSVKLTVKDKSGRKDTVEMLVKVKGLSTKATEPQFGDEATYDTATHLETENYVAGVFTITDLPSQIITQLTVQRISADLTGDQVSSEKDMMDITDGMGALHSCAHRHVTSDLDMTGTITTDLADVPISGNVKVTEDAYRLTTSGKGIRSRTDIVTTLDPISFQGIPVSERMTSKDNVTIYNDLTTLEDQFDIAEIFRGRTFSSQDQASNGGNISRGNVTYKWRYDGTGNMAGRPSIKLNATVDAKTMAELKADELYIDIWVGNNVPVETGLHIYFYSKEGDTVTMVEHMATLTSFVRGLSPITPKDGGPFLSAHPLASSAPFDRTPLVGDLNSSAVVFPPDEALTVAENMSTMNLTSYLLDPGVFLVNGNYTNDPYPRWSMVFSRERSDKGFLVNVTRKIDPVSGQFTYNYDEHVEDITPISVPKTQLPELLNLSSAEDIIRTDPKARVAMFDGSSLKTNGTYIYTQADVVYPTSELTFSAFSPGRMPYAYRVTHSEGNDPANGSFTVALSAINGQFMYTEEHSGKGIPGIPGFP